jgi:hypothetical protein
MGSFFASSFERSYFTETTRMNDTLADNSALLLADPFNLTNPDFMPLSGSPVLNRSIWAGVNSIQQQSFNLSNYPNPFNGATTIEYTLLGSENVSMQVYDLTGRVIRTLVNENQVAGTYEVNFDASDLQAGLYFVRFSTHTGSATLKIVVR